MAGYGKSITGKVRKTNEDTILVINSAAGRLENLYAVADGMGGHLAGEVASGTAVDALAVSVKKAPKTDSAADILSKAFKYANKLVYEGALGDPEKSGMGTTLLAATVSEGKADIVNIGDSRLYVVNAKKDRIEQITVDHSFVTELLQSGRITPKEAERHPKRNLITRALGVSKNVKCDVFSYELEEGDILLMCTDGLTNMLINSEILDIVKTKTGLKEITEALLEEADVKGGIDNISAILYSESYGV